MDIYPDLIQSIAGYEIRVRQGIQSEWQQDWYKEQMAAEPLDYRIETAAELNPLIAPQMNFRYYMQDYFI